MSPVECAVIDYRMSVRWALVVVGDWSSPVRPAGDAPTQREQVTMRNHCGSRRGSVKVLAVVGVSVVALAGCSSSSGTSSSSPPSGSGSASSVAGAIKVGVLTTCGGPFAAFEAESFSGAKYALVKYCLLYTSDAAD